MTLEQILNEINTKREMLEWITYFDLKPEDLVSIDASLNKIIMWVYKRAYEQAVQDQTVTNPNAMGAD